MKGQISRVRPIGSAGIRRFGGSEFANLAEFKTPTSYNRVIAFHDCQMPRSGPVKVACRLCHDRRVKCDRSEGVACSNCRNARRQCELIISQRGR
jgi:hypothetical protein